VPAFEGETGGILLTLLEFMAAACKSQMMMDDDPLRL